MAPAKIIKSALHHWWPRSLSAFWTDKEGGTVQLSWDGTEVRLLPKSLAGITNAHSVNFGGDNPWNFSFEDDFGKADTQFPDLARWLLELDFERTKRNANIQERLLAQPLTRVRREQLAEGLSSLIVRSPGTRNKIRKAVEYYRQRFGLKDYQADKNIIAGNLHRCHDTITKSMIGGGKFIALISETREFIFGDGFLHNFPASRNWPQNARCLIPILPSVTMLFAQSTGLYRILPELITLNLRDDEVLFLNDTVQIYSKDHVFYRSEKPKISEHFLTHQFLEYTYHRHDWLEALVAHALGFTSKKLN